jgi:uncharacterized membrane protein YcaP (DUF421 family)
MKHVIKVLDFVCYLLLGSIITQELASPQGISTGTWLWTVLLFIDFIWLRDHFSREEK